ncbi:MAG: hypothetical protein QOI24_2770 [Acidobacteriota bacterium]|jgi:hypothetical protein|nr:hypothetical protein [Acidobacteriota bacterium]
MFRTRLTLKPGRPGTKRLLTEYGDRLVCVRYRYDDERKIRCKTVELIVDEITWPPLPPAQHLQPEDIVSINVEPSEKGLRDLLLRLRGTWIPAQNTCRIPYELAALLNLTRRIVTSADTHIEGGE